jgi:hypothetical protein
MFSLTQPLPFIKCWITIQFSSTITPFNRQGIFPAGEIGAHPAVGLFACCCCPVQVASRAAARVQRKLSAAVSASATTVEQKPAAPAATANGGGGGGTRVMIIGETQRTD